MVNWKTVLSAVFVMVFVACNDDDDTIANQRTAFEKYIQSFADDPESLDGIYRYVANADRDDYRSATVIQKGDSLRMYIEGTIFQNNGPASTPFYTNFPRYYYDENIYLDPILNFNGPMNIKLGSTPLMGSLNKSIPGCREGDSVRIFLTSDLAFGDKPISTIPENSPIIYTLRIDRVKKQ